MFQFPLITLTKIYERLELEVSWNTKFIVVYSRQKRRRLISWHVKSMNVKNRT